MVCEAGYRRGCIAAESELVSVEEGTQVAVGICCHRKVCGGGGVGVRQTLVKDTGVSHSAQVGSG